MRPASQLRIALAQVNPTVGDIAANQELIAAWIERARAERADVVVFPELVLSGYPPEDLLLKRHFIEACEHALGELATLCDDVVALIGYPEADGDSIHNSLGVLAGGTLAASYRKLLLPNYGVFDEGRYFEAGEQPGAVRIGGAVLGLTICEDSWVAGRAATGAIDEHGAQIVLNASASPYHRGKGLERERAVIGARAIESGTPHALCNLVGGQDELVFDGHSFVVDGRGEVIARAGQFAEELLVCDVPLGEGASSAPGGGKASPRGHARSVAEPMTATEEVYAALVTGLRDYVTKNGFESVLLSISGGIDSALVALLAADALGPQRLVCVSMPSPYTSEGTREDARAIPRNLGSELIELSIGEAMETLGALIAGPETEAAPGGDPGRDRVTEENLQARIRGNLVMALSNRTGWLVLTTGNKSEMAVGYATLYGDMAGGFAVLKDVPKTLVYELVRHRNEVAGSELVPLSTLERPPSAELSPGQRDDDSLPPYDVLDPILAAYIEADRGPAEIAELGFDRELVERVISMVDRAEYKRRQAPPGVKVTPKAFGRDRRLPITNRFEV